MADTLLTHNQGKTYSAQGVIDKLDVNAEVRLIKADFTQNAALVFADLTFANFSGYAHSPVTYGSPAIVSGASVADGGAHVFTHSGGGTANTIYGEALVDSSTNELLGTCKYDSTKSMAVAGDQITVNHALRMLTE